jgi:hypothetical protein
MPVPDFSPGEVLTAAAMDSIGLWKTASGSATSGTVLSIQNCFSADYEAYRVVLTDIRTTVASGLNVQLANGGTPNATGYGYNYVNGPYATTSTYAQQGGTGLAAWPTVGVGFTDSGGVAMDIYNPFLSQFSIISSDRTDPRAGGTAGRWNGFHAVATSFSGIYIVSSAGTFTNINATVYGYRR